MIRSPRARLHATASISAIAIALLWSAPSARAGDTLQDILGPNPYVTLFGGGNFARSNTNYLDDIYDVRLKNGFTVGAAMGNTIDHGLRFERELSYQRNKNDKTRFRLGDPFDPMTDDTEATFLLANLWKDIDTGLGSFYVGGGIGTAFVSSKQDGEQQWNDTGIALAAQLGAGLRVAVSNSLALDLGYRLKGAMDAPFNGVGNSSNAAMTIYSHNVQLGLSYALGEGSQIMPTADLDASSPNWYVSVFGGGFAPEDVNFDYGDVYALHGKAGFTLGAAVGTHLAPGLRGELELSYLRHAIDTYTFESGTNPDIASGHIEQIFLLANIWKNFKLGMLSPYVGGGIGFATTRFDNAAFAGGTIGSKAGLGLAGQLGAGVRFGITDNLAADFGYRFKSSVNAFIEGTSETGGKTDNASVATYDHVFQFGLTYGFGEGIDIIEAPAIEGQYVSLFGGGVFPVESHVSQEGDNYLVRSRDGFSVGAAIGATIADHVRGEIELSHLSYEPKSSVENGDIANASGNVNLTFLMANVWRDVDLGIIQPYGGFGVGMALADVDINLTDADAGHHINDSRLALAAQAGAGMRLPINDSVLLDVGYRFKAAMDVLTKGDGSDDNAHGSASHYAHVGQVGVTWRF